MTKIKTTQIQKRSHKKNGPEQLHTDNVKNPNCTDKWKNILFASKVFEYF